MLLSVTVGTPELLPGVISVYLPKEGRWACDIQATVLRFWLRHDPPAALEALKRALASRERTRCYTDVLSQVLHKEWNDAALPDVTAALSDPDPEVTVSAIKVLEAFTDTTHLEPSLAALQRLAASTTAEDRSATHVVRGAAQRLLESPRWKPDAAQREQLQAIVDSLPR